MLITMHAFTPSFQSSTRWGSPVIFLSSLTLSPGRNEIRFLSDRAEAQGRDHWWLMRWELLVSIHSNTNCFLSVFSILSGCPCLILISIFAWIIVIALLNIDRKSVV